MSAPRHPGSNELADLIHQTWKDVGILTPE